MKNYKDDNYLLYVPSKKHDSWKVKNNKVYLVFYHNRLIEKIVRWLVKKPYTSDIELDDVGSKVWMNINGKNNVYDISKILKTEYGDKFDPEYKRIILFLNYMNKKGWVSFKKN